VCALSTVWLAINKTIWTWPVQMAGSVLLFVVYVFFFVLVMIGFRDWLREYRAQSVRNPPSEAVAT
jgi:hypothetical protein